MQHRIKTDTLQAGRGTITDAIYRLPEDFLVGAGCGGFLSAAALVGAVGQI